MLYEISWQDTAGALISTCEIHAADLQAALEVASKQEIPPMALNCEIQEVGEEEEEDSAA